MPDAIRLTPSRLSVPAAAKEHLAVEEDGFRVPNAATTQLRALSRATQSFKIQTCNCPKLMALVTEVQEMREAMAAQVVEEVTNTAVLAAMTMTTSC